MPQGMRERERVKGRCLPVASYLGRLAWLLYWPMYTHWQCVRNAWLKVQKVHFCLSSEQITQGNRFWCQSFGNPGWRLAGCIGQLYTASTETEPLGSHEREHQSSLVIDQVTSLCKAQSKVKSRPVRMDKLWMVSISASAVRTYRGKSDRAGSWPKS